MIQTNQVATLLYSEGIKKRIKAELGRREKEKLKKELARRSILDFTEYTFPTYSATWFHRVYCEILDCFIRGSIKKLIITVSPQHGKSELSTRRLPAFLLGKNPELKLTIASYNTTMARRFSVQVQRIIADKVYREIFPGMTIPRTKWSEKSDGYYSRTMEECEIINHNGVLRAVGRGGALTGHPVDVMIMDDLYKDYAEANSPVIRESVIDWYTSVVRSRLHNDSQELIVFTRWHEEDLIGWLEKREEVILLTKKEQLVNCNPETWYKINFPALATEASLSNEFDRRREVGQALWGDRHARRKLEIDRDLDSEKFESLYQGDPMPRVGLLYQGFNTYVRRPDFRIVKNYTDSAGKGKDFVCSINYGVGVDDYIYVLDIYYSDEVGEVTEPAVAALLDRDKVKRCDIESNSGGEGFARSVKRLLAGNTIISDFHQTGNKESRVISNAAEVQRRILFPPEWANKWLAFARDLLRFKKNFRANTHDDAPDALTGVLEKSGLAAGGDTVGALNRW